MSLGKVIRALRNRTGLSQQELAERAGLSQPLIAKIESGRTAETRKLPQLATAFGLTVDQLLNLIRDSDKIVEDGPMMVPAVPHAARVHLTLTHDEKMLLSAYRSTSRSGKQAIFGAASGVLGKQLRHAKEAADKALHELADEDPTAAVDAALAEYQKVIEPEFASDDVPATSTEESRADDMKPEAGNVLILDTYRDAYRKPPAAAANNDDLANPENTGDQAHRSRKTPKT